MSNITNIEEFSQRLRKDLGDHFDIMMAGRRLLKKLESKTVVK